ncbi:MAG: EpsI family protein [candidate division Zixibacteria bacterium]|nr:EpsI family protein [candidate division Zixibacteria bacterium]
MGTKTFIIMLAILAVTFLFAVVIRTSQPETAYDVRVADFPLEKESWVGEKEVIPTYVFKQLNPVDIFAANYVNDRGEIVNLVIDYFAGDKAGGPHSPRNCLPGSGWAIESTAERKIPSGDRTIPAQRFALRLGNSGKVMDFWYITRYGETANDYALKFYTMLSSLTLHRTDVAFIRFVCNSDSTSLAAMDRFQQLFLPDIYARLPFD